MQSALNVILTALAVAAAVYSAYQARQTAKIESSNVAIEKQRDARDDARALRAQADLVAAWPIVHARDGRPLQEAVVVSGKRTTVNVSGVLVSNRSNAPVYRVEIDSRWGRGGYPRLSLESVPPGDFFVDRKFADGRMSWDWLKPVSETSDDLRPQVHGDKSGIESIEFTDASGSRWFRDPQGALGRREAPTS